MQVSYNEAIPILWQKIPDCVTLSPVTQPTPSCVLKHFYLISFLFPSPYFDSKKAFLFDHFSFPFIIFSWISQHMHEQQRAIGIDTYNFMEVNFMISALMHSKYPLCTSWNETGEQWILYEDFAERQKFWHLWSFDPFGTIRTLCSFGYFHE